MKLGKTIKKFEGWDNKTGAEIYGSEIQPTDSLEEKIRMDVIKLNGTAQDLQSRMRLFAQGFQKQAKDDTAAIQSERARRFPWIADPKLMDYSVNFNGHDMKISKIREDIISLFPTYKHHDEAVQTVGDMMVGLIIKDAEIAELRGAKQVEAVKVKEEEKVEPSSKEKPRDEGGKFAKVGKVGTFDMSDAPEGL